jgi:hypothetical protein
MLDMEIAKQIQKISISEQIEIIELILQSLRTEIETKGKISQKSFRPFRVRKFSLGEEVTDFCGDAIDQDCDGKDLPCAD